MDRQDKEGEHHTTS